MTNYFITPTSYREDKLIFLDPLLSDFKINTNTYKHETEFYNSINYLTLNDMFKLNLNTYLTWTDNMIKKYIHFARYMGYQQMYLSKGGYIYFYD
uniref:Uncharacterized protein n=1 Tax=viral metagenome TaxID=1070528 RepID=A0A6C0CIL6_9ZZZZ